MPVILWKNYSMVSFARTRAKTWLTRLWPVTVKTKGNETLDMDISKELIKTQQDQNNCFLEAIKNGGLWFS